MPPLPNCDSNGYNDVEEDDGKGEILEEHAKILHCMFPDFCCPPPSIWWALTALCTGD
jgi:hypothetical protein